MEKFIQHIENLLAQHDYVVVPNLGGFVVQLQSAQLFDDKITPPLATVGFNPLMHHADGLLAIGISRSEHISYRSAMEYIDLQVESIKTKLKTNKSIQIGKLGILSHDSVGNIIFTPEVNADFLPQNFGLSTLYISTKESLNTGKHGKITITLPTYRSYKYIAAAMLIFGLFFISPRVSDVSRPNNANLASMFYHATENSVAEKTMIISKPSESTTSIVADTAKNFHVIVACLHTKKIADKFCNELIDNSFIKAHVLQTSKTYRVAIQSFSNRNEAVKFMEALRKSDSKFETAWVLCN